ncbi:MAG: hypothetical protein IKD69_03260, partial [Solobacterium sp.]|nr:hypothetical protein [Solobacterium sp.]
SVSESEQRRTPGRSCCFTSGYRESAMIVVSDSTPLITLMKAGTLEILHSMFGTVQIPEAVFFELTGNERFRDEADMIRNCSFIQVVKVHDPSRVEFLQRVTGLDLGESEAIIFADETNADVLLMDEAAGRRVAKNMRLPLAGSVGILVNAYQLHLLSRDEAVAAFNRIRNANRHISERLIQDALNVIYQEG